MLVLVPLRAPDATRQRMVFLRKRGQDIDRHDREVWHGSQGGAFAAAAHQESAGRSGRVPDIGEAILAGKADQEPMLVRAAAPASAAN
jgi:hypothetical protein